LLAIILVTPLTLLGFSAAAISIIIPPLGGWVSWLSLPFLNALLMLVQWGDGLSWAKWTLPSPSPVMLVLLYAQLFVVLGLLVRLKRTPLQRKILIGLVPFALMLGLLCLQKSAAQKETQIALLPLSFRHEGYLIQPAGQTKIVAVLPSTMNYFESRAVADYLKHRNISALEALVLLPEVETGPEVSNSIPRSLLRPLKQVSIRTILTTPEIAQNLEAPIKTRILPANGTEIQWGPLLILAQFPKLQIITNHRCLLGMTDHYQSDSDCAVQVVQDTSDIRLFSTVPLDARQYYELRQQGQKVDLY
jgi:hypothetical protein